jgi:hypothetical protein
MVFHGDYEVEFEIYETREGDRRPELLGHMVGVNSQDAKIRWVEAHEITSERFDQIMAVYPKTEWR